MTKRTEHPAASSRPTADEPFAAKPATETPRACSVLSAVGAWLADDSARSLAITGPVGVGTTTVLAQLRQQLSAVHGVAVVAASAGDQAALPAIAAQVGRLADRRAAGTGPDERIVLLVDDFDRLDHASQHQLRELPENHAAVRLVVTATYDGQLEDVITLPIQPLAGSVDMSVADHDEFLGVDVVRTFLECIRHHNPGYEIERCEQSRLAQICAASFGIPAELELLAELVDRCGLGAICDALTEHGPRHHLAELLGDLGATPGQLSADETLVLASIFASPGGASASMLRQTLPRCDIDASTVALISQGLVFGSTEPDEDELRGYASRYHLRVSAVGVASRCASQPEVSLAAIRYAQADYLQAQIRRMKAHFYAESQRAVFLELDQELPNLRCTIAELIDTGRCAQAVALMSDALPLLQRTTGAAELLPDLLRVIRICEPTDPAERQRLALLAVQVFCAGGEQEAASVYLEQLQAELPARRRSDPASTILTADLAFLGVLAADHAEGAEALETLRQCVEVYRAAHDSARLTEASVEYFAHLLQAGDFEQAEADCRAALSEATRGGDGYAAAVALLWRAVAASRNDADGARLYVERALTKLRGFGPAAAFSAVRALVDNRNLRNLTQSNIDLAMVVGAVSRTEFLWPEGPSIRPPVIPEVEQRLTDGMGFRAVRRWTSAGASADLIEMLSEMLKRRYVDGLPGAVELRRSGVTESDVVNPEQLGKQSTLTAREAEVASLVATGLTNKQVAFRLHISEWTVINHLRQVMRKLDCTSRVQVARWVSSLESASGTVESSFTAIVQR